MSGQQNVEEKNDSDSRGQQKPVSEHGGWGSLVRAGPREAVTEEQGGRSLSSQESPGSQETRQMPLPPAHVTPPTVCRTAQEAVAMCHRILWASS